MTDDGDAAMGDIPVNVITMIGKGLSVHGWPSGHAVDSEDAIAMAEEQGIKVMVEYEPSFMEQASPRRV